MNTAAKSFGMALLTVAVLATAQANPVVGTWRAAKSLNTGKAPITVRITRITQQGKSLVGRLTLVNPDGTQSELDILGARVKGKELTFSTQDGRTIIDWRLTVQNGENTALIEGGDRRRAKFGSTNGEALIRAMLTKARSG